MPDSSTSITWESLRDKWRVVPNSPMGRVEGQELISLSDAKLRDVWERMQWENVRAPEAMTERGWYHILYLEFLSGKRILDIGSGLAISGLTFMQDCPGSTFVFADIVETNLEIVKRISDILGLQNRASFHLIEDAASVGKLPGPFDVVMGLGSLHNAPAHIMEPELKALKAQLKPGGRWLQLAYPEHRWRRDGSPSFTEWGIMTDGPNTPWCEWVSMDSLLSMLGADDFDPVLYYEWHNREFNWLDLKKRG